MAKYTIELGNLLKNIILKNQYPSAIELENVAPYSVENDPYKVVAQTRTKFFDFTYPLYNEAENKERLETKLLTHYFDYEIGVYMPLKFKFLFRNTLNEIMPYYNKLYKVIETDFNPLLNSDIEETTQGAGTNQASNTSKNTLTSDTHDEYNDENNDTRKQSDTPQGELDDIYDDRYVSNLQHDVGHQEGEKDNHIDSETNLTQSNTGQYSSNTSRTTKGVNGVSKSKLLMEYTKAIQNVDLKIIQDKEIQSLFMQIW